AGPASKNFGEGGNNNSDHYLIFNNSKPNVLVSVLVNASSPGNRTIELRDAANNILQSATVYIASGDQTVPLNFYIPVANNLRMGIWTGTAALYRNSSGATYPYVSTDGSLSIISNDVGSQQRYYFFYNWQLQAAPCVSVRVPVTANVVCTSIDEPSDFGSIVLTPNPATSLLNVQVNNTGVTYNSEVIIRNVLGEAVMRETHDVKRSNSWNFDVSAMPAGVYILTLESGGNMLTRRFVKK
ncbi:MAG TPA: T9SS type A sorting domain-containing protein, partial [Chitinophagales bacterium]|nr:T9SS type A sorting domain-containing protein [Chitinophagales bacterium]